MNNTKNKIGSSSDYVLWQKIINRITSIDFLCKNVLCTDKKYINAVTLMAIY